MPYDSKNALGLTNALFHNFIKNFISCFKASYLPLHLVAIALTVFLVLSGADWQFYQTTSKSGIGKYFFSSLVIGALFPILMPIFLLFFGMLKRSKILIIVASTIIQAAILGLLLSFFYKSLTGRVPPDLFGIYESIDISRKFRFGFLEGGVFWGWPSSHTSVAFAVSVAIMNLFPKHKIIRAIALLFAFYIGIGVAIIGAHWLSDFLAAIIYGSIVGFIVGKSYSKLLIDTRLQTEANFE